MSDSTFTLDIVKGKEYYLATILDLIGEVSYNAPENDQLSFTITCRNDEECRLISDLLGHLQYVKAVKSTQSHAI